MPSWLGRQLCRLGFHRWRATGSRQSVIPTGSALLITSRIERDVCRRRDCGVFRERLTMRRKEIVRD